MSQISVVIPVYNVKEYLRQCIESVLSQSFRDFDIILVDDGSTDGSESLCDDYSEQYSNVTTIHQENSGPAASRKAGVLKANGDYIVFIDSDDYIDSDYLEFLMDVVQKSKADVVTCEYESFYPNGKREYRDKVKKDYIDILSFEECIYQIHGSRVLLCGPVCKLIKKGLFAGINWYEDVMIGEDYSMCLELFSKVNKIRVTNRVLYHRRMSGNNISRSGYTERHKKALDNYISVRSRLIEMFPIYRKEIIGYHIEYEMAVITAMCRNTMFDKKVLQSLKKDVRLNLRDVLKNSEVPVFHKISAILISCSPWLFIPLFRIIHIMTGR